MKPRIKTILFLLLTVYIIPGIFLLWLDRDMLWYYLLVSSSTAIPYYFWAEAENEPVNYLELNLGSDIRACEMGWMLDTGYWIVRILDAGCWDTGYWMLLILDTGCWMLDTGCWILDTGYWILDAGYWRSELEL